MSGKMLLLENQLCFPLYALSREIIKKYKPLLDPIGLTYTQYITMLVLWEQDGLSVKDIGARLYLDSGTLTPLLKAMEKSGLITRRRSELDERAVNVQLTEKGKSLKAKAEAVPLKMAACLGMTADELDIMRSATNRMLDSFKK